MDDNQKVVVVTGGSRGLGLGLVKRLLQQGYLVATCSTRCSAELKAVMEEQKPEAARLFWEECRLGDEGEEAAFFDAVNRWRKGNVLFALVNNAAVAGEGILSTFPTVDVERILSVNLLSAVRLARLALRVMLASNLPGRIINISSIVGLRGYVGLSVYSASKAGLDGVTRSLAREVGRRGITVNSVAPGYLQTELSASLSEAQRKQICNRTPLGRLGVVQDVIPAVEFLLSEQAGFITGHTLVVDGGITC